jgi:hypothetical protein
MSGLLEVVAPEVFLSSSLFFLYCAHNTRLLSSVVDGTFSPNSPVSIREIFNRLCLCSGCEAYLANSQTSGRPELPAL